MNPVLWASMASPDVLGAVDLMLPNLVTEEDLELLDVVRTVKQDTAELGFIQSAIEKGGVLTAIGLAILAIPDPLVYSVGFYFGGPVGGWVAVAAVNIVGFGLIFIDIMI